jgi:hypothetical protein
MNSGLIRGVASLERDKLLVDWVVLKEGGYTVILIQSYCTNSVMNSLQMTFNLTTDNIL